ncbi:MAG: hypothetical protein ACLUIG_10230 [Barnesiella intestinihominis]
MNPKHPLSTITIYRLVASFILAISIYSCPTQTAVVPDKAYS